MPQRFAGTVEILCNLDVTGLVDWAHSIPMAEWPKVAGSMRGPDWRWASDIFDPCEQKILSRFPGSVSAQHYFSMIFPGGRIAEHCDPQPDTWLTRIHAPILTNPSAMIFVADGQYHLKVGEVYMVSSLLPHSVCNDGPTPRLHWIFDVHAAPARL